MTLHTGDQAPEFNLQNAHTSIGESMMSLEQSRKENGLIVVFECNHCPYVIGSIGRLEAFAASAASKGIGFVGINSNDPTVYPNDSFEHMQKRATGMSYPYLHDEQQDVAHAYGAMRTPEFFLFNADLVLVYSGRMDDSPQDPTKAQTSELADAVEAMLSGSAPAVTSTQSIGCSVKWKTNVKWTESK
tara:strand:+ start:6698 stop:7261 length:564 start_codon:yes stop_codon:yes gene_type:complete